MKFNPKNIPKGVGSGRKLQPINIAIISEWGIFSERSGGRKNPQYVADP
jgi:hypothetical protein